MQNLGSIRARKNRDHNRLFNICFCYVCQIRILVPLQVITNVCEVNIFGDRELDTPGHYTTAAQEVKSTTCCVGEVTQR